MIKEKKVRVGLFLLLCILASSLTYAQTQTEPLSGEQPIISVEGRLVLEKHGQEDWLVLHAKNAETYLIIGEFKEKLKNSLLELGKGNLISVTGKSGGRSKLSCEQNYQYKLNKEGQRELAAESKCIWYYNLGVTQLLFAKKSDEEMPPPKRDIEEEKRMTARDGQNQGLTMPLITGEIYGKITSVNLKSVVKAVEVANRDKDSPLKNIALVITPGTQIAKKIGKEEPMFLKDGALKAGQEIIAVYSRSEFKSEALFITITKE